MSHSSPQVGPAWLQLVWTGLFSMGVGAAFTILGFIMFASGDGAWRNLSGWGQWYLRYLVVSLAIGYTIQALFGIGRRLIGLERIRGFSGWQRSLYFSALPIVGLIIGMTLGFAILGASLPVFTVPEQPNAVAGSLLFMLLVWFLFSLYFSTRHRRIAAERRATEAQLKLLQGQIEPHFLFNTLANVVGLMDHDTPRAKLMLESFVDYLRSSLGSLRMDSHTLGQEIDLVDSYLRIIKIRMDDRLHYSIDVPDALRASTLPALSLQPLVENAVVHGLEPQIEGGHVRISARNEAGALVLTVEDDGRGLPAAAEAPGAGAPRHRGSGTALNNIRERLLQAHGSSAALHIESLAPHGVRARLRLPAVPSN